jgi:O-antigen/teichoic acid export membrane protein
VHLRALNQARLGSLPKGSIAVGSGLILYGLTAYAFLAIAARMLGPTRYAPIAVMWALIYLFGPGFFLPLEQELARAVAARRTQEVGIGNLHRRAAMRGAVAAAVVVALCFAFSDPLVERLFDQEGLVLVGLALAMIGYYGQYLSRGLLAGTGRFGAYGLLLGAEGLLRIGGCLTLAAIGIRVAGPYALVLGLAPIIATTLFLRTAVGLPSNGPEAPRSELTSALGYLFMSSLLAQFIINAPPLAVKILAPPGGEAMASQFLASVVMTRIPLFFFQAVQAAALPRFAELASPNERAKFRGALRRLVALVGIASVASVLGAVLVGRSAISLFFGAEFALERSDLGYLASGSSAFMMALLLAQALIAISAYRWVALGWLFGAAVLVAFVAQRGEPVFRAELGFLLGSLAATAVMALSLRRILRARPTGSSERLQAEGSYLPLELEP